MNHEAGKYRHPALIILFPVLAALLLNPGCATNPVTGRPDFVLMSEDQEIAVGRKSHPQILEAFGRYEDAALQRYVQSVGERLAKVSHRAGLVYRFTVLDSPDVNAFALPGGYIYITRGLLAYLNSEAELAAVLGHEIGHVTARHAVRQYSAAATAGILGAVLASEIGIRGTQDIFNILGTAILRGYGREHELEADRLGAEYLARAGYTPQAMIQVIRILKAQEEFEKRRAEEEGREPRIYHGVFATHPDNDRRLQEVVSAAERLRVPGTPRLARGAFLKRLDGLVYGPGEREGVVRGSRFYHAGMDFSLAFPEGWRVENLPDRLVAHAPRRAAWLQVTAEDINRRIPPRQFMIRRLGLAELRQGRALGHETLPAYTALVPVRTPYGPRTARVTVLYFRERAFIFTGAAKAEAQRGRYDQAFLDTALSFHALTPEERSLAKPYRLRIIPARDGVRFADLARSSPFPGHPEARLRLLNGYYPTGEPTPGEPLKIVE